MSRILVAQVKSWKTSPGPVTDVSFDSILHDIYKKIYFGGTRCYAIKCNVMLETCQEINDDSNLIVQIIW